MTVVSRYNLLDEIGQGFMGIVHRAQDRLTGRIVALKQVRVATSDNQLAILAPSDSRLRLAFAQEFRILASLRHPHIISVLDYGFNEQQQPFFTMDFIEDAQNFIEASQNKPLPEQVKLLIQLLQALAYLHRRDIVHRDVKPANVLVADDHLRVLDFGLSSKKNEGIGRSGTLAYMAPEVLRGRAATMQSDLYAVGVMLFEMLTGKLPYDPVNVMARLKPSAELDKLADHPLELLITRLLMPEPTDRYANAEQVIEEISQTMNITVSSETEAIRESYLQTAPFVGREDELSQLKFALDKSFAGQGSVWLVSGESGVGKSRLLEELRIQALVDGALVVRGQGVEGGGIPYQLWQNILPRLILGVDLTDDEANILRPLIPQIETLIGRELPEAHPLAGKDGQQQLIDTVAHILRQQVQPVVIILEDLQWAIESLALLRQIAPLVADKAWMLIGSYRHDEHRNVPDGMPDAHVMRLKRLDEKTIAELSYGMLGEIGKQPAIVSLLQRETEGNAFFIVEVVRTLAEEAGQMVDIGRMTLPSTIFAGGIHKVNQRRISRLPQWGQPLLKLAAVSGRQIDEALLEHNADGVSIEQWLSLCADAAILEVDDNRWRFVHDKMRESIVTDLTATERPLLHQRVAEAIEAVYPDDMQQAVILAKHWQIAGDSDKEAFYTFQAAQYLRQLGLNQAQTFALRALNLNPSDPLLWSQISNLVSYIYFESGDYPLAQDHYEASLAHARKHQLIREELTALDGLGQIIYVAKDMLAALKLYEGAVKLARNADDNFMLARLLKHQGAVMRFLGDHEGAFKVALASLEVSKKLNNPHELALILYSVSVIVRNRGEYHKGIEYLEEGIAIFRKLNAVSDLGHSLNNLGICHNLLGNHDVALQHLEEGIECRRQVGHIRGVASSKSAIGDLYFATKRYDNAGQMYQEALDFWLSIGDRWNIANSHADVGFPLFIRGEINNAKQHWIEAIRRAYEIQGTFVVLKGIIGFAWLAHHAGDKEQAIKLLSIAQSHSASTKPLAQLWIQPLLQKLNITELSSLPDSHLEKTIEILLAAET